MLNTGWNPIFIFHILLVVLMWVFYLYRKSISLDIKVFTLSITECWQAFGEHIPGDKVLSALIGNAIKFTDSGKVTFGYFIKRNEEISIYVKDTGTSIPRKNKKIIFDLFMQGSPGMMKKYGGAGMELAIIKTIMSLLNGSVVVVDSKVKEGSTFTLNYL